MMENTFYQHYIYADATPVSVCTDPTVLEAGKTYTAFMTRWDDDAEELVVVVQRARLDETVLRGEDAEACLAAAMQHAARMPEAVKPAA
jgi:hypothetical protein